MWQFDHQPESMVTIRITCHSSGNQQPIKTKDWFSHVKNFCMRGKPPRQQHLNIRSGFSLVTQVDPRSSCCDHVIPNQIKFDQPWSNHGYHSRVIKLAHLENVHLRQHAQLIGSDFVFR